MRYSSSCHTCLKGDRVPGTRLKRPLLSNPTLYLEYWNFHVLPIWQGTKERILFSLLHLMNSESFLFTIFLPCWGLSPRLHTCKLSILPLTYRHSLNIIYALANKVSFLFKWIHYAARETAMQLKAHAALSEDLCLFSSPESGNSQNCL